MKQIGLFGSLCSFSNLAFKILFYFYREINLYGDIIVIGVLFGKLSGSKGKWGYSMKK
jgi:hypothetical protein